ncbi:MAG TPA: ammonia-forming cytochrome c nitrite reductase subunit c552 [bacterium]
MRNRINLNNIFLIISIFEILTVASSLLEAKTEEKVDSCVECHRQQDALLSNPVLVWEKSIHMENRVGCADCHGGNPASRDNAMAEEAGFIGVPVPQQIPALCAKCHADVKKMRQFNIRTDQFAEYKTSIHGKMLFEKGDAKVATCISCHGSHEIRKTNDPASPVFHSNVPATCGKCHSDPDYMKPYGIPTDQLNEYKQSYHGKILFGEIHGKNRALVPNCADCHGIHGAIPPGGGEVANVCGNCHSVVLKSFREGSHYTALENSGVPKCIDCHGNHKILYPGIEMFKDACSSCHDAGSIPLTVADEMADILEVTRKKAELTESSLEIIKDSGRNIDDLVLDMSKVTNNLVKSKTITHTVDLEKVKGLMTEAQGSLSNIDKKVEEIRSDVQKRKKFMFTAVGFLGALIVLLYIRFLMRPE